MSPYENINIFGPQIPESIGSGDPNYLLETLGNVPSSAYQLGSDVAQVVTSPVQTLDAIANLGLGLIALAIPDAYQEESLDKPQEAAMAVGQYISDRYGGFDKVKETLKTDPVGLLADVSGILLGGGYLATKSGLKAGQLATKAGIATDPLVIAGKGASQVGKGITRRDVLKGAGAGLASLTVPMSMMTDVTKAIPPVAKSSGVLAGIGKFKGIIDNISPYLYGSKKREDLTNAIVKRSITNPDINQRHQMRYKLGETNLNRLIPKRPKIKQSVDSFHKKYSLNKNDFSKINIEAMKKLFDPNSIKYYADEVKKNLSRQDGTFDVAKNDPTKLAFETQQSANEIQRISRQLDNAPDKKVTELKMNDSISGKPTADRIQTVITGTVEGVPVYRIDYVDKDPRYVEDLYQSNIFIPNESGLAKLSKVKQKKAKGGLVESIDIFQKNS